jgi:hypothetical protein
VPLQRQIAQGGYFFDRLLNIVFTKRSLPSGMGLSNRIRPESFGNGQQGHSLGIALGSLASSVNSCANRK